MILTKTVNRNVYVAGRGSCHGGRLIHLSSSSLSCLPYIKEEWTGPDVVVGVADSWKAAAGCKIWQLEIKVWWKVWEVSLCAMCGQVMTDLVPKPVWRSRTTTRPARGGAVLNGGRAGGHAEGADGVVSPPLGPAAVLVQAPDADNRKKLQTKATGYNDNNDQKIQKHSHSMASNSNIFFWICASMCYCPELMVPRKSV